jgi:hypothetical protein
MHQLPYGDSATAEKAGVKPEHDSLTAAHSPSTSVQKRAGILGSKTFLGVPVENFEAAGNEQLAYLLRAGATPSSKVVDIGCGVLRGGYWIIHFLDPGCYCGIEPHKERLRNGIHTILEPGTLQSKQPRFDTNDRFDTSVFGEKFDFFLAYSIWTHASKSQIRLMLDSFVLDSAKNGIFLTTFLPAGWLHRDYRAEVWFGTSHQSDVPGCIRHSFRWINKECEQRGLAVVKLGRDAAHGQSWLQITRRGKQLT